MGDLLIRAGCFVAIIILGFVLRKVGFFKENAFEVLSKVVVKITLPAAIVKNFATSNMDVSMLSIAALGFGGSLLYIVAAYLTHLRKSKEQQAFAVLNLPGKYREVILLYYDQDMKLKEIAQLLHLPQNTVSTRLRRARKQLQQALEGEIEL